MESKFEEIREVFSRPSPTIFDAIVIYILYY